MQADYFRENESSLVSLPIKKTLLNEESLTVFKKTLAPNVISNFIPEIPKCICSMKTEHCNFTVNTKLFYTTLNKQSPYLLFSPSPVLRSLTSNLPFEKNIFSRKCLASFFRMYVLQSIYIECTFNSSCRCRKEGHTYILFLLKVMAN